MEEAPLVRTGAAALTEIGKEKEELLVAKLAKMAMLRAYDPIVVLGGARQWYCIVCARFYWW